MPPKKATDYGNPNDPADFTFKTMQERINAFLRDTRDTKRGGAGILLQTLLLRRLRSAIREFHIGLRAAPNMSRRRFAWGYDLLRRQAVRVVLCHTTHVVKLPHRSKSLN